MTTETSPTRHPVTFTTIAHILGYRIVNDEGTEMTNDEIRKELDQFQGLILDTDDRIEWKCLNDELKRRGETPVTYKKVRMSGSRGW
jgi:hypothetical protein